MPFPVPGTDGLQCPLDLFTLRQTIRHAWAHPWPGNRPLDCPKHFLTTTAILEPGRPLRAIFSLDVGYHASGWFPNSTMDRCLHLSCHIRGLTGRYCGQTASSG